MLYRLQSAYSMKLHLDGVCITMARIDLKYYNTDQIKYLYFLNSLGFKNEIMFLLRVKPEIWVKSSAAKRLIEKKWTTENGIRRTTRYAYKNTYKDGPQRNFEVNWHIKKYKALTGEYPKKSRLEELLLVNSAPETEG